MTIQKTNLRAITAQDAPRTESGGLALWGLPVIAAIFAALALVLVWLKGDLVGAASVEARKTDAIWILCIFAVVVIAHLVALGTSAYSITARLFRRETGDSAKTSKPLKRDIRLQHMRDELRTAHGWFWRYKMPWLMINGSDDLINEVVPGLKQAGVIHVADAVLVHATPDGIDSALWRKQIHQLRHRRPVDSLVQLERIGDGVRPDAERARTLAGIASDLGWAAPVTFLHAVKATGKQPEQFNAVGAFVQGSARQAARHAAGLKDLLTTLEQQTADGGVRLCREPDWITWLAQISAYIGEQRERIVTGWEALIASRWLHAPLAGVMFVPLFETAGVVPIPAAEGTAVRHSSSDGKWSAVDAAAEARSVIALRVQPASLMPTWQEIGRGARLHHGRRVGFYWPNAIATFVTVAAIGWCVAMTISFIGNRHLLKAAQAGAVSALASAPGTAAAMRSQLALQQQIELFEYRQQHGTPWYLHAGLNRNDDILDELWQPYQTVASRNLQQPAAQTLQAQLTKLSQVRADALQTHDEQRRGYNALKAYLMLVQPGRTDPTFLAGQIVTTWAAPAAMSTGDWLDTSQRLAAFYADHLKAHPEWRINASQPIVTAARNTLVNQIGLANADDTVYQSVLDDAKGKYADASLMTLLGGTDAIGLFSTTQMVPGVYTRAAWDGIIADAIDKASIERHTSGDWVLSTGDPAQSLSAAVVQGAVATVSVLDEKRASDTLKQRLTARYFAEYTAAWQVMLNSVQWQPATNLNGAIDQLTRLADAQTSPLIALMKSVQYQAQAGRASQALTDTLVRKAQSLIGSEDKNQPPVVNPLDKSFGPLLALMGDSTVVTGGSSNAGAPTGLNGVSLAHYLTVATTMRLKLQQIAGSPDAQAMARVLAQAVFQGKLSELAQARDDAALTAASLGSAWAGFGDALFARPLDTSWETILQPAAASLNEAWRASVAAPFNNAMNGRYPFFETNADASFAELGHYVRPDTGLITRFISMQLAGVLKQQGDQWVPNELAPQALQFDPKFLAGIRQLSTLGAQMYAQGDAASRFEMMALPTANVTRSELAVDGKQVVYFNQQESWTPLTWPGDGLNGHAGLTWQTVNAGLRQAFDSTGDWAFLRLLSKADVKQLDSTRYQLIWNQALPDHPASEPLRYVLRAQVGAGPLDLLKLRGFRMPERIFVVGKTGVVPVLPPLPPELSP
jgi:type VI secretion system protein ImpL